MIGDAGLALEGFRKAQRYDPNNPAALQGIGDCYTAMGRFDIAQSNYEAALALAPHDRRLLLGLADIFEREGLKTRAMAVRAEAGAVALAATIVPSAIQTAQPAAAPAEQAVAIPAPALGSITVNCPPAAARRASRVPCGPHGAASRICRAGRSVTVALPPVRPAADLEAHSADLPATSPGICASLRAGDRRTSKARPCGTFGGKGRRFGRPAAGVFSDSDSRHGREGQASLSIWRRAQPICPSRNSISYRYRHR